MFHSGYTANLSRPQWSWSFENRLSLDVIVNSKSSVVRRQNSSLTEFTAHAGTLKKLTRGTILIVIGLDEAQGKF
jgi:hypothetical protein